MNATAARLIRTGCPECQRVIQAILIGNPYRQHGKPHWRLLNHGPKGERCPGSGTRI